MAAADRIVVLRGGKVVAERLAFETNKAELAELIVGCRVTRPMREGGAPGEIALEAREVTVKVGGVERLKQINFRLRAGEILAVIGVSGNGQAALGQLFSGTLAHASGELLLFGEPMGSPNVAEIIAAGLGRIPEDRSRDGAIGEMAIWENAVLERLSSYSKRGLVDRKAGIAFAQKIIEAFDVRGGAPTSRARLLSGGNMQKLVLGRNLYERPRILIAAQPARGLDEGAVAAVHGRILQARRQGTAVLLISEDLDEVIALADRVQAIVGGRLSAPIDAVDANARLLGLMMAGEWNSERRPGHAV
jgi:simple sugar transport system ATP-binding protein